MVKLDSPQLFRFPLLVLAGNRALGSTSTTQMTRLRTHLTRGGLLLVDDIGRSGPSRRFDESIRKLIVRATGQPLVKIPLNDVVYRTFYRLRSAHGRRADVAVLWGAKIGKRWAVLYSQNDLHGAFSRARSGGYALPVLPGGEHQREQAWRLGINLVLYAVSLDYKDDHTHVGHLLRRRRGQ